MIKHSVEIYINKMDGKSIINKCSWCVPIKCFKRKIEFDLMKMLTQTTTIAHLCKHHNTFAQSFNVFGSLCKLFQIFYLIL